MLGTFIVIFREMFEVALILGIVLAATRGVPGRNRWALIGIAGGVAGSVLIAVFAEMITGAFEGTGQEIMNGTILLLAALMIGWTTVWMKTHAREMAQKIKCVGKGICEGEIPLYSLAVIVALAVFREGSEMVLFSLGLLASGTPFLSFITGVGLGAVAGALLGFLVYIGLIKIFTRHFFAITSWMLAFLAAGMAAQGVNFFAQAGHLPEFGGMLWNTSHILSEDSLLGETLKVMLGYSSRPTGTQLIAYAGTLAVIAFFLLDIKRHLLAALAGRPSAPSHPA